MSLDQPPPASFDALPWHQRSVVTALLVLFLGPIGAVFMWQFSSWSISWKMLGTVYSVLYILVRRAGPAPHPARMTRQPVVLRNDSPTSPGRAQRRFCLARSLR